MHLKDTLFQKPSIFTFLFRYYSQESLVGDPDFGPILSSLLVGPCALEYTKVKSNNHWYELPANELVQR